jgi:hypothetical protein
MTDVSFGLTDWTIYRVKGYAFSGHVVLSTLVAAPDMMSAVRAVNAEYANSFGSGMDQDLTTAKATSQTVRIAS